VTWLYQPLPLASTVTSGADASEALDATATTATAEAGSCTPSSSVALSGSASTCSAGSFNVELLATSVITSAAGSTTSANNSVRLRSRKSGGASGTASQELNGTTFTASSQSITSLRTVSVLLGGTGITTSIQSFPTRVRSHLLGGIQRTMSTGNMIGTQEGTGFLPSWVQLPTQVNEENYYDTVFGIGKGKDEVWFHDASDKAVTFDDPPETVPPSNMQFHNDTEGDDLWNHYQQYKRTGLNVHLLWAQKWRDYMVSDTYLLDLRGVNPVHTNTQCNDFDHLYVQGLVMWAMEQNDPVARARVLEIGDLVDNDILTKTPGVSNLSDDGSRRWARRLICFNWIVMMEPTARWIQMRDHLLECWLQNPGWEDTTTTAPTIIGGNHFDKLTGSESAGGWNATHYSNGLRFNHSFYFGLISEALWVSYKMITDTTKKQEIKDMLVQMARYILHYAWDPIHQNPMCGARWGHRPLTGTGAALAGLPATAGFLHDFADEFGANAWPGYVFPNDPNLSSTDNYESSHINTLVYAYKLTGEAPFLKRAREHLRQATNYANATGTGQTKIASNLVRFFMDTKRSSTETSFFDFNKGMLQYASFMFENNGLPAVEDTEVWTPPYQVPTSPGEVVKIAGDTTPTANTILYTGNDNTGSTYNTNVYADVRPSELSPAFSAQQLTKGDTRSKLMRYFSPGGAVMMCGSGGHKGISTLGASMFDFTDARWKRVWTHSGDPGVDNITNEGARPEDGGPPMVDVRTDTRVHNITPFTDQVLEYYIVGPHVQAPCWNSDHWLTGGSSAAQRSRNPIQADPRDQFWEVSHEEPLPYVAGTREHGWKFPGEWNGLVNGRFTRTGYITPTVNLGLGGRFDPTPAGTLEPTQSEMPAPAHIWEHQYEMTEDEGGGPKSSLVVGRIQNIGDDGKTICQMSHRFDLNTGIWHEFSTGRPTPIPGDPTPPAGGGPTSQPSAVASAEDWGDPATGAPHRAFLVAQSGAQMLNRVNYINMTDRTWRNFAVHTDNTSGGLTPSGDCQSMMVDPDRRLLIGAFANSPHFLAIDLQTLGQVGNPEPTPSRAIGGWKAIPYDDIPGVQSVPPFVSSTVAASAFPHGSLINNTWRYYPPNGKYYRVNTKSMAAVTTNGPWPNITVLQRLTPPAIIATPRANHYYTTEALSGRWTLDEITVGASIGGLPVPDPEVSFAAHGFSWFHYVPSLQCLAYLPLDLGSTNNNPTIRRCVYLIKPY
jgi:hypothetical protein